MKKTLLIILVIAFVGIIGVFAFSRDDSSTGSGSATQPSAGSDSDSAQTQTITTASVAEHATSDDCWTIIDGAVYDITKYVTRHPGGVDEITKACGKDATSLFDGSSSAGRSGGHSGIAQQQLSQFKLGDLSD